jgi:beta-N-acetylhexosaminidase
MGLVCNSREAACTALEGIADLPLPNQQRLERMRGNIPNIQVGQNLDLGPAWAQTRDHILDFKHQCSA